MSCSKFLKQRPPVPWKSETTILQLTKEYSKNEHKHLLRNDKKVTQKIRNVYIYAKKYYINLLAIVFHYKKVTLWIDRSVFADDSKEGKTVAPSMKKFRRILWRRFIEFFEENSSNSAKKFRRNSFSWPSQLQWNWIVYIWLWNLWPSCIRCTIYSLPKFINVIWCEMFFLAKGFFKKI